MGIHQRFQFSSVQRRKTNDVNVNDVVPLVEAEVAYKLCGLIAVLTLPTVSSPLLLFKVKTDQ